MTYFGINRSKESLRGRLASMAVNLSFVVDGLIGLFSLGFIRSDIRCWLLFDYFLED